MSTHKSEPHLDFLPESLVPFGIDAIHPDDFIVARLDLDRIASLEAFKGMRARRKRPEETPTEFVLRLERNGWAATAARLLEAVALI